MQDKNSNNVKLPASIYIILIATFVANIVATYLIVEYLN